MTNPPHCSHIDHFLITHSPRHPLIHLSPISPSIALTDSSTRCLPCTHLYTVFSVLLYVLLSPWGINRVFLTIVPSVYVKGSRRQSFLLSCWHTLHSFYALYTLYCTQITPWGINGVFYGIYLRILLEGRAQKWSMLKKNVKDDRTFSSVVSTFVL